MGAPGMVHQKRGDRVRRFDPADIVGLSDRRRSGHRSRLGVGEQTVLKAMILRNPDPETEGVSARRVAGVCRISRARFGLVYAAAGIHRLPKGLDGRLGRPAPAISRAIRPRGDPPSASAHARRLPLDVSRSSR